MELANLVSEINVFRPDIHSCIALHCIVRVGLSDDEKHIDILGIICPRIIEVCDPLIYATLHTKILNVCNFDLNVKDISVPRHEDV
jgi:hypothetical protein